MDGRGADLARVFASGFLAVLFLQAGLDKVLDRRGNVMWWGISGVQKETVLASRRSIVLVEETVDEFQPRVNGQVLPAWVIDAVVVVPGGPHPSYADGYS